MSAQVSRASVELRDRVDWHGSDRTAAITVMMFSMDARVKPDGGMKELELRFDDAMMEIYERAGREIGYWATRYLQMLRSIGGLATARRLLHARTTSEGYARLREAGRLDLTVEAYVLRPEFQPLFTPDELNLAADRLALYHRMSEADGFTEPDPELLALVETAARTPADTRIELYRDPVASFGSKAIAVMLTWVEGGQSPGFAIKVIEAVGRATDPTGAIRALRRLRDSRPDWMSVIDQAIAGVEATRLPARRSSAPPVSGDEYIASGEPPPAHGPCGVRNRDGSSCHNPGRHPMGDIWVCTTHFKAASRRGAVG